MEFLKLMEERYSCRQLKDTPVEKEKIDLIIKAGMCAPTACNYQPFRIFVFETEEALAKIKSTTGQTFIQPSPVIFVVGASEEEAWIRNYDRKNFADADASIAATQMMLAVHDLGLGTTWIGHFDVFKAAQLFPEMQGYSLIAMFAVGYPADNAQPSPLHSRSRSEEELVVRY